MMQGNDMPEGIRVAVGQFNELTEDKLRFAAQIGASGIQLNTPKIPGDTHWNEKDVRALVDKARQHGLALEAIENVPVHFYHKAMLGLPGRDEQIENYHKTLRAVGRAGMPILGYHFMPNSVWRTDRAAPGRGGAACTKFDMAEVEAASTAELQRFLPVNLGRQEAMPLRGRNEPVIDERADVGQLRLLHQRRAAGRGTGRRADGAASRRSAGGNAGRRRAPVPQSGELQARLSDRRTEPVMGPRSLPRLLLGDDRRAPQTCTR